MAGIYLHIPFCKSRCIYCDFYSTTGKEKTAAYIQALTNELRLRTGYLDNKNQPATINTVYIGGGTPSLLGPHELDLIFDTLYQNYTIHPQAEITLEANPDDLSDEHIRMLSDLPVNRLSIGIQTFDNHKLDLLHRRHTGEQAIKTVRKCQEAGFGNISIDLIYGLPAQTLKDWEKDIRTALSLHVQHLSAYALTYEEGTRLWNMREQKFLKETDEDTSLAMFSLLMDLLSDAGFEHYEISNFAKPGLRSRHNSSYWKGIPYLGCGPSAHSFDGHDRQWNRPDLAFYINGVRNCRKVEDFNNAPWIERERLSLNERYNDRIITALRTTEGLNLTQLGQLFGNRWVDYCLQNARKHIDCGNLEIKKSSGKNPEDWLRLTRHGLFLSDGIMSDLLYVTD